MATTFVEYTGDGNATKSFSFPSYQESDVKVRVDGVLKTTSTHYNITGYTTTGGGNVVFTSGNIPNSPATIRIYRDTNVDTAKATFTAGSSVKAADLNNNTTQLLYRAQEEQIPNLIHSWDIDDGAITNDKILVDAVTGAKIADDSINSEHYVDGSIDTAHIADGNITTDKIATENVTSDKIAANAITSPKIADNAVLTAFIADSNVTTAKIADGNITRAKIAADAVNGTKIADDSINSEHYVDGSIDTAHIADDSVTNAKIASNAITTSEIVDNAITTAKIGNTQITTAKIADGNVTTDKIAFENVTSDKVGANAITSAKIATNAVTTDKIADSELTTLAGMQSATASKLADSTALTADIADLNQIDGMQKATTVTDDDTKFPTSGAIVDYVAAQLEPFGGFEAIANESSFPNTQPASGVVISIADAGGMAVSGSGTASGSTVGGTTVNITGIASNFNGTTITNGVRFLVVSTGSGQNYTYHKATLREDDLANLSGDINDFSERYRVGSSNPTTSLDNGDLFFNTGSGKLLVYNGTNSAWEETQSVGNFFINTISSSSGTGGGSATPNGTAYRFTISNAGANAEQHLVSVDGVIQKPNSGTSQPSEGFAINGADIIFGSAPVSGASIFVVTIGASVSIGTPSNNTVTSAILQNGSVTTAKIVDDAVTMAKIANGAVGTNQIADGAIVNADINASAAIAGSKISPSFTSDITIQNDNPAIFILDTNNNDDFSIRGSSGMFRVRSETDAADRLVVNSSGNVGIGTSSPASLLTVSGATPQIRSVDTDGTDDYSTFQNSSGQSVYNAVDNNTHGKHLFQTAGTERMRIDASGRMGIGTTSPNYLLDVEAASGDAQMRISAASSTTGDDAILRMQVAGTAQNNYIYFGDGNDSNAGQIRYSHSNNFLSFTTNAAERMRIDSSGNVGINVSSPARGPLHIHHSTTANLHITNDTTGTGTQDGATLFVADTSAGLWYREAGNLRFATNNSERMLIDSSGDVGIGTSSPGNVLDVQGSSHSKILIGTTGTAHATGIQITHADGNSGEQQWQLQTDASADGNLVVRNATTGNKIMIFDSDVYGVSIGGIDPEKLFELQSSNNGITDATEARNTLRFRCNDSTTATNQPFGTILWTTNDSGNSSGKAAFITATDVDSTGNGQLLFGTGNPAAERMRILGNGRLCVGTTSTTGLGGQTGASNVSTFNQAGITLTQYGVTAGFYYDRVNFTNSQYFIVNSSGTGVYLGSGATSWTGYSDERLKENITELDSVKAYNHVKTARAASFNWNATGYPTDTKIGFIAQDWETNYPEVTNSTTETIDEVENPKGIQYTETIPVLMAALKQAISKIEVLETKVATLEAA